MGGAAQAPVDHGDHVIQFYGDDDELAASVGSYLSEGPAEGGAALVLATPAHRAAIAAELAGTPAASKVLMVDAAEMLQSFLDGGRLDKGRFQAAATSLMTRAAGAGAAPLRIYAEMVALLWDAGEVALAIDVEELWNGLAEQLPFDLLCAYPSRMMTDHGDSREVVEVCRRHGLILGEYPAAVASGIDGVGSLDVARGFPAHLRSAREARHFVLSLLHARLDPTSVADAGIIIAELAANVVQHARSPFRVRVVVSGGIVRINVVDAVRLPASGLMRRPGHGLDVVSKVARRWAIEPLPGGKLIWAELPAAPRGLS